MVDLVAYDAAFPNVDVLCASGASVICCYTDGMHGYIWQDVAKYRAAGKGILPNHERGADDLLGGYQAGLTAANECMQNVAGWQCPQDGSVAIFYSVDVPVPEWQYPTVGAAFDGIRDAHRGRWKIGVYGQGGLIDYLAQHGQTNVKGWLSASASYPGYNRFSPNVGMYQLVGTDIPATDKNIITDATGLGVWWPGGLTPSGGGTQIGTFLMALTDAQQAQMLTQLDDLHSRLAGFDATNYAVTNPILQAISEMRPEDQQVPSMAAQVKQILAGVQAPPTLTDAQITALAAAVVAKLPASTLTAADVQNACSTALAGTPLLADLALTIGAKTL